MNFEWDIEETKDFDYKYHRDNDIPIRIYKKDWEHFVNDLYKTTGLEVDGFNHQIYNCTEFILVWIYKVSTQYMLDKTITNFYILNNKYNINYAVTF